MVPLTSQRRRGAESVQVAIPARDRLLRECWAMAEQPRALDRNRIGEGPLTRLSAEEMTALEQALQAAPAGVSREALANKAVIHSLRSELFQLYVFSAG